jgi:hypothetical protein
MSQERKSQPPAFIQRRLTKAKGCVHVQVKNGLVVNIFEHLTDLPENGVIYLVPEHILSEAEF